MSTPESLDGRPLRRGWTTGACATAATKAALSALLGHDFLDPVQIILPGGQSPSFALAAQELGADYAKAGIIKDAGDDPDVTHGALVWAEVRRGQAGAGVIFKAGQGVGMVTKAGLPIGVGEPAINPVPRRMMTQVVHELCDAAGIAPDFTVTVGVEDGDRLAEKTWNPRLGIVGGLSILGTTGIVVPYSCAAWIASIQRGVDVARAMGLSHLVGATGDTSEKAAMARLDLPLQAFVDMGDFVGGLLKYIRRNPVETVTIAGGFAKLSKLAQGAMDLHSARGTVDFAMLAEMAAKLGAAPDVVARINTLEMANQVLALCGSLRLPIADSVAEAARAQAQAIVGPKTQVKILVVDRGGTIVGEA